ncbi:hypothetical protein MOQ95_005481 [Salmonella enterica]|nr:hypothetical protein [Salmonella enterica]
MEFLEKNFADHIIDSVKNDIADSFDSLEKALVTGFISEEDEEEDLLYEVIIPYGDSGYEYCYFIDSWGRYIVSGFKHQKENDYY